MWQVNLMSHVHAARRLIPGWLARGHGYFLSTASAAGLLTNLKAAQYSVTKHAAVAFAEWLAIAYGDQGNQGGAVCARWGSRHRFSTRLTSSTPCWTRLPSSLLRWPTPSMAGLSEERFLILPPFGGEPVLPEQGKRLRPLDWGMKKLQRTVFPG